MNQRKEWIKIQESYDSVRFNQVQKNTEAILKYIKETPSILKKYKTEVTVLARQLNEGEIITLSERTQKTAKRGQWLVHENNHKQKILEEIEFEFFYDKENPVKGSGNIKSYRPRKQDFYGFVYEGAPIDIRTSNKGIIKLFPKQIVGKFSDVEFENLEVYDSNEFKEQFSLVD
jgi:hypothetical protein